MFDAGFAHSCCDEIHLSHPRYHRYTSSSYVSSTGNKSCPNLINAMITRTQLHNVRANHVHVQQMLIITVAPKPQHGRQNPQVDPARTQKLMGIYFARLDKKKCEMQNAQRESVGAIAHFLLRQIHDVGLLPQIHPRRPPLRSKRRRLCNMMNQSAS